MVMQSLAQSITIGVIAIVAFDPMPSPACATPARCECFFRGQTMRERVAEWSSNADVVFLGMLVRVDTIIPDPINRPYDRQMFGRFRVERAWKGTVHDTITVPTDYGMTLRRITSCDPDLPPGKRYVFFGRRTPDGLLTDRCSGTTVATGADSLLTALGPGRAPTR
jgi:hypothetical protein